MAVTIQQAASNALQTWIAGQLTGGVVVDSQWPGPDTVLPAKAVTILLAGPRQDSHIPEHILSSVNSGAHQANVTWQYMACEQPLQIDVWATDPIARDDILAQLDQVLNAGNRGVGGTDSYVDGLLLQPLVADNWANTFFDYEFHSPDIDDTPDSIKRSEYRATMRGTAYMMLQATRLEARQVAIIFKAKLHTTDTAASTDLYDITTITATGESHSTGP